MKRLAAILLLAGSSLAQQVPLPSGARMWPSPALGTIFYVSNGTTGALGSLAAGADGTCIGYVSGIPAVVACGSGSGDVTDVNITATSPLTGTASCSTGACSFTLGLSALVDADISNSAAIAWSKVSKSGALASEVGAVTLWPSYPGTPERGSINLGNCAQEEIDCDSWIHTGGLDIGSPMTQPPLTVTATVTGNPADKPAGTYLYAVAAVGARGNPEDISTLGPTQSCVLPDFGTCRLMVTSSKFGVVFFSDQGEGTLAYRASVSAREPDLLDDGSHLTWTAAALPTVNNAFLVHWFSEDGAQVGAYAQINEILTYGQITMTGRTKNGYQPGEPAILLDPNGVSSSVGLITMPGGTVDAASFTGNATTATALAANGTNCSSGQAPLGVDASGAAEGCFAVVTPAGAQTLTSKRITPRVGSVASSATPSIDSDAYDLYEITALAVDITSVTVTGTPVDGQTLWLAISPTAARAITLGSQFEASSIPLPTTTGSVDRLDLGFVYNFATSKWRLISIA